jgi:hypothetical protein
LASASLNTLLALLALPPCPTFTPLARMHAVYLPIGPVAPERVALPPGLVPAPVETPHFWAPSCCTHSWMAVAGVPAELGVVLVLRLWTVLPVDRVDEPAVDRVDELTVEVAAGRLDAVAGEALVFVRAGVPSVEALVVVAAVPTEVTVGLAEAVVPLVVEPVEVLPHAASARLPSAIASAIPTRMCLQV